MKVRFTSHGSTSLSAHLQSNMLEEERNHLMISHGCPMWHDELPETRYSLVNPIKPL